LERKIVQDPMCPICGLEAETTYYILWDCSSTRDVRGAGIRRFLKCTYPIPDFIVLVEGLLKKNARETSLPFLWKQQGKCGFVGIDGLMNVFSLIEMK
jgi:hypothetical protein